MQTTNNQSQQGTSEFPLERYLLRPFVLITGGLLLGALLRILLRSGFGIRNELIDYLFNLDSEYRFAAWFAGILFAIASALWFTCAIHSAKFPGDVAKSFRLLGWIFALCSLDEITAVHEGLISQLRAEETGFAFAYYPWVFVGMVFVLVVSIFTFGLLSRLPQSYQWRLILSAVVFLSGAIGLEIQGAAWAFYYGTGNYFYLLITTLEEFLEFVGVLILISCLIDLLLDIYYRGEKMQKEFQIANSARLLKVIAKGLGLGILIQALCAFAIFSPSALFFPISSEGYREAQSLRSVYRKGTFSTWTQPTYDTDVFLGKWHNDDHLLISFRNVGEYIDFEVKIEHSGYYRISAFLTKGWDYGVISILLNGEPLSGHLDLYNKEAAIYFGPVDLAQRYIEAGTHRLTIKVEGRNPDNQSPHYNVGFDGIQFLRVETTTKNR